MKINIYVYHLGSVTVRVGGIQKSETKISQG